MPVKRTIEAARGHVTLELGTDPEAAGYSQDCWFVTASTGKEIKQWGPLPKSRAKKLYHTLQPAIVAVDAAIMQFREAVQEHS